MAPLRFHTNELGDAVKVWPLQKKFILVVVQAHAEPDTPYNVEVGTDTSHEMPIPS